MFALDGNLIFLTDKTLGTNQFEFLATLRLNPNLTDIHLLVGTTGGDSNDKTCMNYGDEDLWGLTLNSTLEVTEIHTSPSIKLYPNPTSNFITIENNNSEQFLSIDLLDYAGKHIKSFKPNNTSINLSDLNPGIYLLQMSTEKGNFCERICLE
jgi:hypothetical protein